jgi:hypothetical protein
MYRIDRENSENNRKKRTRSMSIHLQTIYYSLYISIKKMFVNTSVQNTPSRIMIDSGEKNATCRDNEAEDHRK